MKNLYLILGTIILVANFIIGMVITSYAFFNVGVNSVVIIANTLMMYAIASSSLSDGFKISLSMVFPLFAFVELILGFVAPDKFENNWYIVVLTLILVVEFILLAVTGVISNINKKKS